MQVLTLGKTQLSTELTISAEEFDVYDVYSSPITIAFHLREFNVSALGTPPNCVIGHVC